MKNKKKLSATELGKRYNISSELMNWILKEDGFLMGEPGNYDSTNKAFPYVKERTYPCSYNSTTNRNYYSTRSYDTAIQTELNMSPERIKNSRAALDEFKQHKLLEKETLKKAAVTTKETLETAAKNTETLAKQNQATIGKIGKYGLVVAIVAGTSYGVYKAIPHIKKWWNEKKEVKEENVA